MAKLKYKYNVDTCRYERFQVKGKLLRNRIALFFSLSLTLALGGYFLTVRYFESVDEALLKQKNDGLKVEWNILHQRIDRAQKDLAGLIEKDDHNYRVILDSNPLEASIREAGIGGSEKFDLNLVKHFPLVVSEYVSVQKLQHQLEVEIQSYEEIERLLNSKLVAWATRPAIQPINNRQLDRLHLSYGARLHPIFHVYMDHKGLDFAAAHGTPVYATGDGKITMAYFSDSYGNVIYLDHGYEFETRYAHLSSFAVKPGDVVKRGQVIGYVGNTGNSVSSHLHYEVLYGGVHVNPISFFQRDLSNEEYQKLIDTGSKNSISLD
jgi:murein DD-endopeptidase MepM/ murein hydrolase activator NlpD